MDLSRTGVEGPTPRMQERDGARGSGAEGAAEPRPKPRRGSGGTRRKSAADGGSPGRGRAAPAAPNRPWWRSGWTGLALWTGVVLAALYLAYALFVTVSDGTLVELRIEVGTQDGVAFVRCAQGSTPSVCLPGATEFEVEARDRVRVTLFDLDGDGHTVHLEGSAYALWPAGFAATLEGCDAGVPCASTSFTAWSRGEYRIVSRDAVGQEASAILRVR